jgi:serine/threonine-protein kinase
VLGARFVILSWIGSGGMGVVYKARDRQLNEVVALKTLRPELSDPEALEALKSELRIARRITHRNVLRTHDFGEANGVPFISMEYVRGVALRELVTRTRSAAVGGAAHRAPRRCTGSRRRTQWA